MAEKADPSTDESKSAPTNSAAPSQPEVEAKKIPESAEPKAPTSPVSFDEIGGKTKR